MTLRERIADVISGGALSAAKGDRDAWKKAYREVKADYVSSCCQSDRGWHVASKAHNALRAIIERGNTASPNSTVKAMVRIAKEGLGG